MLLFTPSTPPQDLLGNKAKWPSDRDMRWMRHGLSLDNLYSEIHRQSSLRLPFSEQVVTIIATPSINVAVYIFCPGILAPIFCPGILAPFSKKVKKAHKTMPTETTEARPHPRQGFMSSSEFLANG
uniref:Uncharacterized protein n=1 Tax=Corethron hystrix TaxID=216773 RepID=A0A7S1BI29_9STRA|mmetsp:Transcript_29258/g.67197  ORF Transcript_29258/g.67197 Transcript_29258/m.67197 type:complete len:126 (+) Transcript_29258:151-528(+)